MNWQGNDQEGWELHTDDQRQGVAYHKLQGSGWLGAATVAPNSHSTVLITADREGTPFQSAAEARAAVEQYLASTAGRVAA